MKIIYAKKSSGIDELGSFQNPGYYDKPNPSAEAVIIYGDYPKIKADYEALSIDVEVRELPKVNKITGQLSVEIAPELQKTIDDAKAECEKVVAENEALKAEIEGIKTERDALALKAKELEEQLNVSQAELVAVKNAGTTGDLLSENTDATTTKETKKK